MKDCRTYDYLNSLEFYTLLAASGREKWYGPMVSKGRKINSQGILNRLIADLYQKGSIEWSGNNAVVTDRFQKAFLNIKGSKKCIVVKRPETKFETIYAYPGTNGITQISVSQHDADSICISSMQVMEWIDELEEENVFPEPIEAVRKSIIHIRLTDEPHAVLELRDAENGDKEEELTVFDEGLYAVLVRADEKKKRTSLCSRSEYERILVDWAK